MSQEIIFIQNIIQSGSNVVLDARKWSINSVSQLVLSAKLSEATITIRNATVWALTNQGKVKNLALIGKKSLILDFSE